MATGAPGTNGVWQYGEDDSEATFSALLNKAAGTTDTQIGLDRARLTTLEAKPTAGLIPIVPTSVDKSGGTASTTSVGQVTFTGVAAISLNGVFSSNYRNYRLVVNTQAASAVMSVMVRFRTSGVDNTSNSYYQFWTLKRISGVIQDNSGGPGTAYSIFGKAQSNTYGSYFGDISSPNTTSQATTVTGLAHGGDSTNSYNAFTTVLFDGTTAFDGISLYPSTGTFTGTVSIYGYND